MSAETVLLACYGAIALILFACFVRWPLGCSYGEPSRTEIYMTSAIAVVFWLPLGITVALLLLWARIGERRSRDSRSKPARAETPQSGSVHESGGAQRAIAQNPTGSTS